MRNFTFVQFNVDFSNERELRVIQLVSNSSIRERLPSRRDLARVTFLGNKHMQRKPRQQLPNCWISRETPIARVSSQPDCTPAECLRRSRAKSLSEHEHHHASIIPRVAEITRAGRARGLCAVSTVRDGSRARSRCERVIHADFDDCIRGSRRRGRL